MRSLSRLAAALVLVAFVAGCSKGNLPPDLTSPDDIAVNAITPSAAIKLAPGSMVSISAQVAYILASQSTGTIVVNVEDQNNVPLAGTQASVNVNSGQGVVSLATPTFTVPTTGVTSVQVFYSLLPAGASLTSTIVAVVYSVGT